VTQRIAIVGASVRAAAASAVRAGFQVAAADLFADADLSRITQATRIDRYPGGLLDWLRQLSPPPDAWMYTGALENHPDLVDAMAMVAPLLGNQAAALRKVRSPLLLADTLQRAGLRFPETRLSPGGLPRNGSWLMKTGRGASGIGVRAFTSEMFGSESAFYQERIAGIPHSATFAAAGGESKLLGIVHQFVGKDWLGAREFQFCGAIGPCHFPPAVQAEIEQIGSVLAHEFNLVGLFGIDLMIDGEQVWTIEVNPRYAASVEIIERFANIDAIADHVSACRDGQLHDLPRQNSHIAHGKAILFARRSVQIGATFTNGALNESARAAWPALADIPASGTTIKHGQPVLTVFAESASNELVEKNLRSRVAEIERAIYSD
jgi:predicted ATP-grasp superfamily ATP-dependent carboligase